MPRDLPYYLTVTQPQIDLVRGVQRKLKLPNRMIDEHCRTRFGFPFVDLDRRQCSQLIDEMLGWKQAPAALQIAQGQAVLPGMSL